MSDFTPISEVLPNLSVLPLSDDHIPIEAVILIKAIGSDGQPHWHVRYTEGLYSVEALGALHAATVLEESAIVQNYLPYTQEDE